jgi:hypothetical protein
LQFGRGLLLVRRSWFRHCDLIIETDISLVRCETHEYNGAENEHRRYWNEPAEIEPSRVERFAFRGLRFGTRGRCGRFRLGGRAGDLQDNCLNGPRACESWFECEIRLREVFGAGARHGGELFAAARASGEVQLVSGGFVGAKRLLEICGQQFGVRTIAVDCGIARKTSPEQAIHCVFVVLRRHDAILLL